MSPRAYPIRALGDLLEKETEWIEIDPATRYKLVTARLWGKGIVERSEKLGSEIGTGRKVRIHSGQFILSRIDARNGAMGIVPGNLEGAIVSNDFPTFNVRGDVLLPDYLNWISKTPDFVELCWRSSEGTTNRVRLKEDRFLSMSIPLPSVAEQQQIVARIDKCAENVAELNRLLQASDHDLANMLMSKYRNLIESAVWHPMERVAPVVRRSVQVDFTSTYPELGIRSFGRGTFHKPTVSGASLGTKRLYRIAAGDLVFNNVFAWEGAVAVAQPDDGGRVGSHRFISCVPFEGVATAEFLCFHFLSVEGLRQLGDASPGGAGRNRTLGLKALARAQVPVPPIDSQHHFDQLQTMVANIRRLRQVQKSKLDAVLPAVLDRAFKGEQ